MIERRLHALEVSMALAIARLDGGGPAPDLDLLLSWHRIVQDAKALGIALDHSLTREPAPRPQTRPAPIPGVRPRLSLIRGGVA